MHQQTWDNMTEDELADMAYTHEILAFLYSDMRRLRRAGMQSGMEYGKKVVWARELEGKLCDFSTARLRRGVEAMKAVRGR